MSEDAYFRRASSYEEARKAFFMAAQKLGATVETHLLPEREEHRGQTYEIDLAIRPGNVPEAPRLLISSGLHGVEGYAGSAAQTEFLSQLTAAEAQRGKAHIILVHGLNPYGFRHHRRWNEAGVDLNRNFLSDERAYRGCAQAYRELEDFINPKQPPGRLDTFWWQAPLALAQHGFTKLNRAIAEGQYEFPQGLFFGGQAPSASKVWLDSHISQWFGDGGSILHLDLHTGLGAYGETQLFLETTCSPDELAQLRLKLHPRRIKAGDELVFEAPGAIGRYLQQQLGHRYQALTLEMGTYPSAHLFRLLRAENQAHHTLGYDHPLTQARREAVFQAFAPSDTSWWQTVIPKVVRTLRDALDHLES